MTDIQTPAEPAGDEAVTDAQEANVTEAEAPENTQGQEEGQPAPDEAEGEAPDAEADEEVSRSKARRERRKKEMDRLRSEAEQAEAENAKLKDQLAEYERRAQEAPPQEADFEDYAEYQAALSAFRSMQALDGREKARLEAEAQAHEQRASDLSQQQQREIAQNWAAQVAEAKERFADFDAVVGDPSLPITQDMGRMIATSDHGADVAYHLGQNRELAREISQLSPIEQAMAIGRLEATVTRPKPRTQTQAPDPVTPVKAKATAQKNPENMTAAEYRRWREGGNK